MIIADLHIKCPPIAIGSHLKVFGARLEAVIAIPYPFRILIYLIATKIRKKKPRNLAGESLWR
jgi:hypothetical protein